MRFNTVIFIFLILNFIDLNAKENNKAFVFFESVRLNNISVNNQFIFDSGSNISIIDSSIFNQLNLKEIGYTINRDILEKKKKKKIYLIEKLKIDNTFFYNVNFIVADLRKYAKCKNILGIIGMNVLNKSIINIDFKNKNVKILDKIEDLNKYQTFNFNLKRDLPFVNLYFNGRKINVLLDTGNLNSLILKQKDFRLIKPENIHTLWDIKVLKSSINTTELNVHHYTMSHVNEISLGKDLKIGSSKFLISNYRNLGIDFFKDSNLILNFNDKVAYLKDEFISQDIKINLKDFIRLSHDHKGVFYVSQITKNGTYEKEQQIRLGDTINFVNNINLKTQNTQYMNAKELCALNNQVLNALSKGLVKLEVRHDY